MALRDFQLTRSLLVSFCLLIISLQAAHIRASRGGIYESGAPFKSHDVFSKSKVAVQGVVVCQSCEYLSKNHSLEGSKPISGATVGVSCKDEKDRPVVYAVGKTDEVGYFYVVLEGYEIHDKEEYNPQDFCEVRLVSSPDKSCAQFTNMNGGLMGGVFRFEREIVHHYHQNFLLYSAGPFAFCSRAPLY